MLYTEEQKKLWNQYFQHCQTATKISQLREEISSQLDELIKQGEELTEAEEKKIVTGLNKAENLLENEFIKIVEIEQDLKFDNQPMFNGLFFLN